MRTTAQKRKAAAFFNDHTKNPTMTDQSAAATTDLNVIVNQFLKTGTSSSKGNPRYGDFSDLPTDLRGIIETARSVTKLRSNLPPQLRDLPVEQLLALTPEQIATILTPPAPTPTPTPKDKQQ